jgi:hypothetical protein
MDTQTVGADSLNVPCLYMQGKLAEGTTMCYINQTAATQTKPAPTNANTNPSQTGPVPSIAIICHLVLTVCTGYVQNRLLLVMVGTGSVWDTLVLLLAAAFQ